MSLPVRLALILSLAGSLAACGGLPSLDRTAENATRDVPVDPAAAAAMISRYRAAYGLGPVTVDTVLVSAASYQASAVAKAGYLSHEVGGTFGKRLAQVGYDGRYAAENLSAGAASMEEAITRWKASPEHNKNLLMPQVRRIGIARVDAPGTRFKSYWALVLASG